MKSNPLWTGEMRQESRGPVHGTVGTKCNGVQRTQIAMATANG